MPEYNVSSRRYHAPVLEKDMETAVVSFLRFYDGNFNPGEMVKILVREYSESIKTKITTGHWFWKKTSTIEREVYRREYKTFRLVISDGCLDVVENKELLVEKEEEFWDECDDTDFMGY